MCIRDSKKARYKPTSSAQRKKYLNRAKGKLTVRSPGKPEKKVERVIDGRTVSDHESWEKYHKLVDRLDKDSKESKRKVGPDIKKQYGDWLED